MTTETMTTVDACKRNNYEKLTYNLPLLAEDPIVHNPCKLWNIDECSLENQSVKQLVIEFIL